MELVDFYTASDFTSAQWDNAPNGNMSEVAGNGVGVNVDSYATTNLDSHFAFDGTTNPDTTYFNQAFPSGKEAAKVTQGFTLARRTTYTTKGDQPLLQFVDTDGSTVHLTLRGQNDGSMIFSLGNYAAAGSALATIPASAIKTQPYWSYIEITVNINNTTGSIVVYSNSVQVTSVTGIDTRNGGNGIIGSLRWTGHGSGTSEVWCINNLYTLSDTGATYPDRLGPTRVQADNNPNAGDYEEWEVGDSTDTDNWLFSSGMSTTTTNQRTAHSYNGLASSVNASGDVVAVKYTWLASDTGAPGNGRLDLGIHGAADTDVYYATAVQPDPAGSSHQIIVEDDPETGSPWAAGTAGRTAMNGCHQLTRSNII